MMQITFNDDPITKEFVSELFNNSLDDEGYMIDKEGIRVIDADGQNITLEQLGLIKKGSEIYTKKNIVSLANFYRKYLRK